MSYMAIATVAKDQNMLDRLTACAAQERIAEPQYWVLRNALLLASQPGWAEAWDSAQAARDQAAATPVDAKPGYATPVQVFKPIGADPAVITDGMILAAVQALRG